MKTWWQKQEDDSDAEPELPKVIQDQLDQVKELKTKVEEQSTKLSKLDSIESMLAEMAKPKEKPKEKPVKTADEEQAEREEIAALLLSDPEAAYARLSAKTNAGLLQIAANQARRDVFDEQPDKFPYYTGDVKAEVNKILSTQPLSFQTNHQAIENTYYTVIGKMQKEIAEGKIKDRFASGTGTRGKGLEIDPEAKTKIDSNDDIRKIARQLGMKEEDYIKLLEEDAERYI
jgi:hypothetical protein